MRDGVRVRFWKDRWCGEVSLETRFPLIFDIVVDWEATVASYLGGGDTVVWDIQLRR